MNKLKEYEKAKKQEEKFKADIEKVLSKHEHFTGTYILQYNDLIDVLQDIPDGSKFRDDLIGLIADYAIGK